jgi:hypothetical protein
VIVDGLQKVRPGQVVAPAPAGQASAPRAEGGSHGSNLAAAR